MTSASGNSRPGGESAPAADPAGAPETASHESSAKAQRGADAFTARVRAAVAARVESGSLRGVSREIGMSATGLSKFLEGNAPYVPTLNRLRSWYMRNAAPTAGTLSEEDAQAAVALLVHDLTPQARHAAVEEVVRCMREGYQASGHAEPAWIERLRERFPEPVEPPVRRRRGGQQADA